ncbi:ectoine/hydroxyectoine ABC transporter substrate-binding protein EhuB [Gordonia liuliyuniae]|uniref:Ectoine/hydroxyectoine ABC transporter substrate-binding protein EhuB n=1 Tax=Gordonia liuliyuniae TaxID=2911517 RepID=A0ABS9INV9_9ACTN|nr:ectoine/hydroxyectoine ABC transporter substrate-binding protein EhuB [Gordonia liuliyuniae]MCF8587225.1 ectoine/hydroxyectoine ABC transporter substrate-binding protein EhuB [Gordonia liuliyuniae]
MRIKSAAVLTAAVLAVTAMAGCTKTDSDEATSLESLREAGVVTVAYANEAPYSFEKDGKVTGATIALHREVFKRLGVDELKAVKTDWGGLIPGLNAKRYDLVSAGMSITPERCDQASFSVPEINYTTALMVKPGNPMDLSNMDSIKSSGAKMAAITGAIESNYAEELAISDPLLVKDQQAGIDAVTSGRADAFALTAVSLKYAKDNDPSLNVEVTKPFIAVINGEEQNPAGATVFRKADTDLRDAYNAEVKKILSDKAEYLRILGPFGFTEENIPDPSLTTEQLCAGE